MKEYIKPEIRKITVSTKVLMTGSMIGTSEEYADNTEEIL